MLGNRSSQCRLINWDNFFSIFLFYYQTNYIISYLCLFLVIFYLQTKAVLLGAIFMAGIIYGVSELKENHTVRAQLRDQKQILYAGGVITWLTFMQFFGYIAIFVFGLILPILAILVHAALRKRNLRNKLNTAKVLSGLKVTPFGIILDFLGQLDNLHIF